MEIIYFSEIPPSFAPSIVALGQFDGMHIGHKALIKETVLQAKSKGLLPSVFTFSSPAHKGMPTLLPKKELYKQMEEMGIERVFEAEFTHISYMSPETFVCEFLLKFCHAEQVVCGYNFRFGKKAVGDAKELQRLMASHGKSAYVLPPVLLGETPVSSTEIRLALSEGNPEKATELLGEPYALFGEITHGKALGRTLQFPTLNIPIKSDFLVPKKGVYISKSKIGEKTYPSITNIGQRPTVDVEGEINCETFLLCANGDFYGAYARVDLLHFIRPEKAFSSTEELKTQIEQDVAQAKAYFHIKE